MKTKTPYENQDPFITQAVKPGFSCQTSIYIFLKQKIVCPSNRTLIGHGLPSVFQLQNVYARQCVGVSVGLCIRHSLCRSDHIRLATSRPHEFQGRIFRKSKITLKFIDHALIVYNWGLFLFRGEDLADLLRLKDRLDFHSNSCAQILHFSFC